MDLVLIGGVSGSGKSVALAALEDSGYYAVSHLPSTQLAGLLDHRNPAQQDRVAVARDATAAPGPHGRAARPTAAPGTGRNARRPYPAGLR